MCPVCHEALGLELAMAPCGHQLCMRCHLAMLDRIPRWTPVVRPRTVLVSLMRTFGLSAGSLLPHGKEPSVGNAGCRTASKSRAQLRAVGLAGEYCQGLTFPMA